MTDPESRACDEVPGRKYLTSTPFATALLIEATVCNSELTLLPRPRRPARVPSGRYVCGLRQRTSRGGVYCHVCSLEKLESVPQLLQALRRTHVFSWAFFCLPFLFVQMFILLARLEKCSPRCAAQFADGGARARNCLETWRRFQQEDVRKLATKDAAAKLRRKKDSGVALRTAAMNLGRAVDQSLQQVGRGLHVWQLKGRCCSSPHRSK